MGLWWVGERLAAVVTHEGRLGEAYFGLDPAYPQLKAEMLRYAEAHLCAERDNQRRLTIYVNDWDSEMEALAVAAGFAKAADKPQWNSRFLMPEVFQPCRSRGLHPHRPRAPRRSGADQPCAVARV